MDQRIKIYLRTFRRRWGFSQRELALLIGVTSGAAVSRIERLSRNPSASVTIACAIVFGDTPSELFPGFVTDIQGGVLRRASELYDELQGNPSKATRIKLDFLEALVARLEEKPAPEI
jgi:transcriptional regulator with XRE-family HTH domain